MIYLEIELSRIVNVQVYDLIANIYTQHEKPEYKKILEKGLEGKVNTDSIKEFFESLNQKILPQLLNRIIEYLKEEEFIKRGFVDKKR